MPLSRPLRQPPGSAEPGGERSFLRRRPKPPSTPRRPNDPANCGGLFVEPPVFAAIAVEDAVDHHRRTFDVGLPARRETVIEDDRPGDILGQLALDRP